MKNLIFSIVLVFLLGFYGNAQDYKTHRVKQGETIELIARNYMVTPFDILALNPDAKTKLEPDMVIIIPKSRIAANPTTENVEQLDGFKRHKVKRKETLYSISRKYNVSVEDIKKYNKRLYSENLRKGDRIQIPIFKTVQVTNTLENTIQKYQVQPKEGLWRVAYKFGITVDELKALNPGVTDSLKVGQQLNVPNIADNDVKKIDDDYGYYTVLPKEGFYRLKVKLGMTQEELEQLNPGLTETGLKAGMVLKIPKETESAIKLGEVENTNLVSKLKNFEPKRIAVMLPFRLNRIDLDSIREARETLRKDGYMSIATDFHTGVLMALDSAKQLGISTYLDVFDTEARISTVSRIMESNDFRDYDAVIGPFTSNNFDRAASAVKRYNVPMIAAVTMPKELYSNVFQTIPSDEFLRRKMIEFVKADTLAKNIIIISDAKNRRVSDQLKNEFSAATQIFSRKDKNGRDEYYILRDDIELQLKEGRNLVFLETDSEAFISNVSSMLSAINTRQSPVTLITTNRNKSFESTNVSNIDLSNLNFHFPSVNKERSIYDRSDFAEKYKRIYNSEPNRYATRGFDLTLDILLRLAYEDDLYDASGSDIETEYIENKFRYAKKLFGGYYNETAYIMKFDNLRIVEAKQ